MSIQSDIYITREEAKKEVRAKLWREQSYLIDLAVEAMSNSDLGSMLTDEYYFINVEDEEDL
jgi:hypothetical protein